MLKLENSKALLELQAVNHELIENSNAFILLPKNIIVLIFKQLDDFRSIELVLLTCKKFRRLVGGIHILSRLHPTIQCIVHQILFPDSRRIGVRVMFKFIHASKCNPVKPFFKLRREIRLIIIPKIPKEKLAKMRSKMKGELMHSDNGLINFLDICGSTIHRWREILAERIELRFIIEHSLRFSDYSFNILLDAFAMTPSVNSLKIFSIPSNEQLKKMLDYTINGRLEFEEIIVEQRYQNYERNSVFTFIAFLSSMTSLKKVSIQNVEFDRISFFLLAECLRRLSQLTHLSIEWPRNWEACDSFGDFIINGNSFTFLKIKGISDRAFLFVNPYFLKCRIPVINFKDGKLTQVVADEIITLIKKNSNLKHLDLTCNIYMRPEAEIEIIREIRKHPEFSFAVS